jgi:hypothetical protein
LILLRFRQILESWSGMSEEQQHNQNGPSWAVMLVLLFLAILVAIGIAYWMLYPFFHRAH